MSADEGHNTFVMPINYEGVRKQFQHDMGIYGDIIVRQISRSGEHAEQVVNPDDVHGFLAALNIALSCVGDGEALNELRTLLDDITGKVAAANRQRHEGSDDDDDWEDENDDDE